MFQTELNLWLQAQGGPSLTGLMWLVSEIGREQIYLETQSVWVCEERAD